MKKLHFTHYNKRGLIEVHPAFHGGSFIHFGGIGFHYEALTGELKGAVDLAFARAERHRRAIEHHYEHLNDLADRGLPTIDQ